jgi:hypothetical protein
MATTAAKKAADSGIRVEPFQSNFTGGEFSPLLHGRPDIGKYKDAVDTMANFVVFPHGPADKRAGTRHITTVKTQSAVTRLIPFIFNTVQAYVIEFGNLYCRFYKNEGQILGNGSAYELTTTFTTAELPDITYVQSADILYLCHPNHRPQELTRTSDTSWTITNYDYGDGPYLAPNTTSITFAPSGTTGSVTITASSAVFTSAVVDVGRMVRIEQSSEWGCAIITGFTDTTHVTATVVDDDDSAFLNTSAVTTWRLGAWYGTNNWPSSTPTFFENRLVFGATVGEPNAFWASRSSDFNSHKPTGRDGAVIDSHGINRIITDNQVNAIHWLTVDNAFMFAGTSDGPFKIWSGRSDQAFAPASVKVDKQTEDGAGDVRPLKAGDAVLYVSRSTIKVRELLFSFERDKHLSANLALVSEHLPRTGISQIEYVEEPDGIVYVRLTSGILVSFTYKRDEKVISWQTQTLGGYFGNATITVTDYSNIATGATLKFTKSDGTIVTFTCQGPGSSPTPETNKFFHNESNDTTADNIFTAINLHADFIVANPSANVVTVEEIGHKAGYLTIVSSDTTRLAITDESAAVVESLAAIPSIDGKSNTLYMIIKRTINKSTVRYIEFLEERFEPSSPTDKDDAFFVDSGSTYSGSSTTSITGLGHLEGETVQVFADGAQQTDKTVSSSAITIDKAATKVHVGLQYKSIITSLPVEVPTPTGTSQGKTKRISQLLLRMYLSLGGKYGPTTTAADLDIIPYRSGSDPMDSSPPLFTGDKVLSFNGPFTTLGQYSIIHDEPVPFTLLAMSPRLELQKR